MIHYYKGNYSRSRSFTQSDQGVCCLLIQQNFAILKLFRYKKTILYIFLLFVCFLPDCPQAKGQWKKKIGMELKSHPVLHLSYLACFCMLFKVLLFLQIFTCLHYCKCLSVCLSVNWFHNMIPNIFYIKLTYNDSH